MSLLHALFLALIGMGAGFVQRVSGFGLGIFAMIFLPHFMPSHTAATAISSLFFCVTSPYNVIRYIKKHCIQNSSAHDIRRTALDSDSRSFFCFGVG